MINGRWRRSMTDRYVELHAASAFSFLEGASQPEKLIERAVELEMPAMALLDRNGVYGSARFHTSAKRNDIRAHVGAEISVSSLGPRLTPPAWLPHQHVAEPARLPLLCESREGYQNLCQLITRFKMRENNKGRRRGHTRRSRAIRIRAGLPYGRGRRTSGSCADERRRSCWPRDCRAD